MPDMRHFILQPNKTGCIQCDHHTVNKSNSRIPGKQEHDKEAAAEPVTAQAFHQCSALSFAAPKIIFLE